MDWVPSRAGAGASGQGRHSEDFHAPRIQSRGNKGSKGRPATRPKSPFWHTKGMTPDSAGALGAHEDRIHIPGAWATLQAAADSWEHSLGSRWGPGTHSGSGLRKDQSCGGNQLPVPACACCVVPPHTVSPSTPCPSTAPLACQPWELAMLRMTSLSGASYGRRCC